MAVLFGNWVLVEGYVILIPTLQRKRKEIAWRIIKLILNMEKDGKGIVPRK